MIIVRAPLRITLGGGGSDVPAFYRQHGGFCISAAINKYVYVAVHETFEREILLKYSRTEQVQTVDAIQHPILREALRLANLRDPHLEIASFADLPAGTGLGSSSAFTVALLKALDVYQGLDGRNPVALAERACDVEINRLGSPIGKQDQYSAALGGLNFLTFCPDGVVDVEPVAPGLFTADLETKLMLFYTSLTHQAPLVLADQKAADPRALANLGWRASQKIMARDSWGLAAELNAQWQFKWDLQPVGDLRLLAWRNLALAQGAAGIKLVGAGAGGFFLALASDKKALRAALFQEGLPEVRFAFDWEGCKVLTA